VSELRDIALIFAAHEERLDAGDEKFHSQDKAIGELHKRVDDVKADVTQELTTIKNQMIIMREAVSEYCRRTEDAVDAAIRRARLDKDTG
jgi:hypothetical protein